MICHDCGLNLDRTEHLNFIYDYYRSCNEPICGTCAEKHATETCVVASVIERAKLELRPIVQTLVEQAVYESALPGDIGRWEEFVDERGNLTPRLSDEDVKFLDSVGILIWEGARDKTSSLV
jgi:hypothetical protein